MSAMKAGVLHCPGAPIEIHTVSIDAPKGHEVLVRVAASGLCHSDWHFISGDLPFGGPRVLGHEVAGVVEAVGDDVARLRVGDPVVACASLFCGSCDQCVSGSSQRCVDRPRRGVGERARLMLGGDALIQSSEVGGFAEQILVHENSLVAIPRDMPLDRAALLGCSVVTGLGSVFNSAQVRAGQRVAVIGCGGVGLNVIQGAQIAGASRIVAVDLSPAKLELARALGATDLIQGGPDAVEAVRDATGGVDHAIEVIGRAETIAQAIRMLRPGGMATIVGVASGEARVPLPVQDMLRHEWRVQGALMGSSPFTRDIPAYAGMYLDGRLDLDLLVSERIALDEVNAGFARMLGGSVARSVIVFDS